MNSAPPTHIQIGRRNSNSNEFANAYILSPHQPPYRLCAITVQHSENYIEGIGFSYKTADNQLVETQHNFCNYLVSKLYYKVTETTFKIDDDDCMMFKNIKFEDIKEIRGRSGEWLDRLEFITYLGKNQNFGGTDGEPFSFSCDGRVQLKSYLFLGHTFGVFGGGHREHIDYLIAQIVPIPDNYIQQIQNNKEQKILNSRIPSTYSAQVQYPSQIAPPPQPSSQFQQNCQSYLAPQSQQNPQFQQSYIQSQANYNYPPIN